MLLNELALQVLPIDIVEVALRARNYLVGTVLKAVVLNFCVH